MTYRQLKTALTELTDTQLDMDVTVSAMYDLKTGNAEFFKADALTRAMNSDVEAAAADVFDPEQPIILFEE